MNSRILILLEAGFEEIETIIPADVLRRIGFEVILAGANKSVCGTHNISIETDILISEINSNDYDCVILPGGMPGAVNLRDNHQVIEIVKKMFSDGKIVAAICAAPIVLAKAGILKGKKATCYPSFKSDLEGVLYTAATVETAGNIITGKGPGASFDFTAKIAEMLGKKQEIVQAYSNMFIK